MVPFFPALSELHQWITESVPAAFISHVSDAFFTALAAGWCNQILESVINGGAEGACWWTSKLQSHMALIICFPLLKRGVALHTPNPQPTGEPLELSVPSSRRWFLFILPRPSTPQPHRTGLLLFPNPLSSSLARASSKRQELKQPFFLSLSLPIFNLRLHNKTVHKSTAFQKRRRRMKAKD